MAPSTRREARLSAGFHDLGPNTPGSTSQDGPIGRSNPPFFPNMEHILENFEAFKRKHIAQNREIIKTNALAQMRIRELENKIGSLETERESQALTSVSLRAKVIRLEHAVSCARAGWEVVGRSLGVLNGGVPLPEIVSYEGLGLDMGMTSPEPELRPGHRITLDPSVLPAGVVRSIARAPESHMIDLLEAEEDQFAGSVARSRDFYRSLPSGPAQAPAWPLERQDTPMLGSGREFEGASGGEGHEDGQDPSDFPLLQRTSLFDVDGPPSPVSSPGLPSDLEDAIAAASRDGSTPEWRPNPPHFAAAEDKDMPSASLSSTNTTDASNEGLPRAQREQRSQLARRMSRRSSRRQSGLLSPPLLTEDGEGAGLVEPARSSRSEARSNGARSEISLFEQTGPPNGNGTQEAGRAMISPPLPLDQRVVAGPSLTGALISSSTILREVTNGVKLAAKGRRPEEANTKEGILKPTPRKARRQKLEPSLIAKRVSIEDLSLREPATPGGVKRKISSQEAEGSRTPPPRTTSTSPGNPLDPGASVSQEATPSETESTFGRARRTRKSINYALPKLNTKMRKPDPVDMIPATPGSSASALRGATPASSGRRVGSSGNLHDLRKQREAASARNGGAPLAENDPNGKTRRRYGPDDEDGNGDGGGASLADLFATNPPRARSASKRSPRPTAASDSEDAGSAQRFWRVESNTDTSDDESRAMSVSDLGELAELEGAMDALNTAEDEDLPRNGAPPSAQSAEGMTKSESSNSIQSTSSVNSDTVVNGRRPSLRRRSTVLPPRAPGVSGSNATSTKPAIAQPDSSALVPHSAEKASGSATESAYSTSTDEPPTLASATSIPTPTPMPEHEAFEAARTATVGSNSSKPQRTVTTRRLSAARLATSIKSSERPKSAGSGSSAGPASRNSGSSLSSLPSSSSPIAAAGPSSLGRAGGASASTILQRGSLHAALTNQSRPTSSGSGGGTTPQMATKGLPSMNSPVLRSSPLQGPGKKLRTSASTSSLATSSSGRSSPSLSICSTNSSSSHVSIAARGTGAGAPNTTSTSSALAKSTTTKQAAIAAAAAASAATTAATVSSSATAATGAGRTTSLSAAPQPSRSMPSLKRAASQDATPRPVPRTTNGATPRAVPFGSSAASAPAPLVASATTPSLPANPSGSAALGPAVHSMSSSLVPSTGSSTAAPLPTMSGGPSAPRTTVRATASTSSMGSDGSTTSSTATVTQGRGAAK